jgi:transposase
MYANSAATNWFLGFDVSKSKVDWSLIDERGTEQMHDHVPNEATDIAALALSITGDLPQVRITWVVEATGCYHHPTVEAAQGVGAVCKILNPIITKQHIRATVRGKKTDRSDAYLIARAGWSGHGRPYVPERYGLIKHQTRSCQKLAGLASSFTLYQRHLNSLLADELSVSSGEALASIQDAIARARKQLARDLEAQTKDNVFQLLQTIPGVGPYVSASLVGEIRDITRFESCAALVAFAGLDPRVRQNGHALNSTGKLTKRGSSYLRRNIFIAANVARIRDTQLKAFYEKKRAEGNVWSCLDRFVIRTRDRFLLPFLPGILAEFQARRSHPELFTDPFTLLKSLAVPV